MLAEKSHCIYYRKTAHTWEGGARRHATSISGAKKQHAVQHGYFWAPQVDKKRRTA